MVGIAAVLAGCGGSSKSPSTTLSAKATINGGPVTTGMTVKAVRATAGRPLRVVRSNPRNPDCWVYGEHLAVCFKHGRVDYIGP